jgi:cell division protein ZipA
MELRQWLIVTGAVIILIVIADAIRRARRARNDALEMSRQMGGTDLQQSPQEDDFNPELPVGGFRVLRRPEVDDDAGACEFPLSSGADKEAEMPYDEPELRADSTDNSSKGYSNRSARAELGRNRPAAPNTEVEGENKPYRTVPRPAPETSVNTEAQPALDEDFRNRFLKRITPIHAAKQKKAEERAASSPARKDEIIVVNVISKKESGFKGLQLLDLLEACGMEMGKMNIFHRYEHGPGEGPIQFSMANAVEPGTFPEGFEETAIPGVSFFVQLPGPEDSMKAYEYMVETAQCLARNLGGELRDERQSAMTGQTIEHGRQRVREFERRQLSVRG